MIEVQGYNAESILAAYLTGRAGKALNDANLTDDLGKVLASKDFASVGAEQRKEYNNNIRYWGKVQSAAEASGSEELQSAGAMAGI